MRLTNDREVAMLTKILSALAVVMMSMAANATEYRTIEQPRQECWDEQVPAQSGGYGGAIVGGIAGGLLGNRLGGGNGKTVATAVGAATGAMVGDRMSSGSYYQTVQRCRTVVDHVRVPVVRESVPIFVPQPVVERVYYIGHEDRYYHRRHWRHHRHDDDDDDDDD
jgi:uncharacterized protein YcfJ